VPEPGRVVPDLPPSERRERPPIGGLFRFVEPDAGVVVVVIAGNPTSCRTAATASSAAEALEASSLARKPGASSSAKRAPPVAPRRLFAAALDQPAPQGGRQRRDIALPCRAAHPRSRIVTWRAKLSAWICAIASCRSL